MKIIVFLVLLAILLVAGSFIATHYISDFPQGFDCNKWGVIYLTEDEKHLARGIVDRGNIAVIVSEVEGETNTIIVPSEINECDNFIYSDYLYIFN